MLASTLMTGHQMRCTPHWPRSAFVRAYILEYRLIQRERKKLRVTLARRKSHVLGRNLPAMNPDMCLDICEGDTVLKTTNYIAIALSFAAWTVYAI